MACEAGRFPYHCSLWSGWRPPDPRAPDAQAHRAVRRAGELTDNPKSNVGVTKIDLVIDPYVGVAPLRFGRSIRNASGWTGGIQCCHGSSKLPVTRAEAAA